MALSAGTLKSMIVSELQSQGFVTSGDYAKAEQLAEAIANAVVSHITSAAVVVVDTGSSAGTYQVS